MIKLIPERSIILKLAFSRLQIKVIFLYWLPWILRMTRPNKGLNMDYPPPTPCSDTSDRKQQIHEVELKER